MAPEVLLITKNDDTYSDKIDVWSLGVLFFFLITGKPLFDDADMSELEA